MGSEERAEDLRKLQQQLTGLLANEVIPIEFKLGLLENLPQEVKDGIPTDLLHQYDSKMNNQGERP